MAQGGDDDSRTEGMTKRQFFRACGGALMAAGALASGGRPRPVSGGQATIKGLIGARPSPYFSTHGSADSLRCELCPTACVLAPGERGACRVRENRRGVGHTLVYGNPCTLSPDPIERIPFFHLLPDTRTMTVATAGCNFSCKFCQSWDVALSNPEEVYAFDLSPADVVRRAQDAQVASVAGTFVEPVVFLEYMLEIARQARRAGLKAVVHTNGSINAEPLDHLCDVVDGVNVDLKGFDGRLYRDLAGGDLQPVLKTLKRLRARGIHLEITAIVIPTLTDDQDMIRSMCRWIRDELGDETPLHFFRFFPLYRLANLPPTPVATLTRSRAIGLDEGLKHVYLTNLVGHGGQDTTCAGCGEVILRRTGFVVTDNRVEKGACADCGRAVTGVWT